jgi:hypothetical protein
LTFGQNLEIGRIHFGRFESNTRVPKKTGSAVDGETCFLGMVREAGLEPARP